MIKHLDPFISFLLTLKLRELSQTDRKKIREISVVKAIPFTYLFVCLFGVYLFHPYGNITSANFDLCSALMAILRVPHLLWHGAFVYNGHLRGPVTLTLIAERLAVELWLPVFTTGLSRQEFEHRIFRLIYLTRCAIAAVPFTRLTMCIPLLNSEIPFASVFVFPGPNMVWVNGF